MLMVPIYAVSSLISLYSLEAAFVIDAMRDIYEVSARRVRNFSSRGGVCRRMMDLPRGEPFLATSLLITGLGSNPVLQAFVIYCFFVLLLSYLGGERSLLILLHGRPPKEAPFPVNLFRREIDVSDPYTFLFLKRGILRAFLSVALLMYL